MKEPACALGDMGFLAVSPYVHFRSGEHRIVHTCTGSITSGRCGTGSPNQGLALPDDAVPIPAKILIVDDQELVRRTLRSLLGQQRHWKIYEASDGQEAIDEIKRLKPDVAILDIVMPRMSGIEAAYEMRRLAPDTKIILMSSHYTPEEAATLARLFGDGNFVAKSEMGRNLVPAISRILRKEAGAV